MSEPKLVVSFRTTKLDFLLRDNLTVHQVKQRIIDSESTSARLLPSGIKLLFKGNVIENEDDYLLEIIQSQSKKPQKTYKIIATGRSPAEIQEMEEDHAEAKKNAPRIRDDLTKKGQREVEKRKWLGRQVLQKAANKTLSAVTADPSTGKYGFGRIETLPNLSDEEHAREILNHLANDPGILAVMKKHKWNVGSLAELYPEGKVGESSVCVMGLNKNKGQQILLRLRTDDLKGFRKVLSIRKVLYHELAHCVHSEHDSKFFQLMRQIEKECNELDWTHGRGFHGVIGNSEDYHENLYSGGTYRLGRGDSRQMQADSCSGRELRARAALSRMTEKEAEEIEQHCGCQSTSSFLPKLKDHKEDQVDAQDKDMDTST